MTLLTELVVRTSALLAIGLLLDAVLRRRSAALRHRVLACAMLAAASVVPFQLLLPQWAITLPAPSDAATLVVPSPQPVALPSASEPVRLPDREFPSAIVLVWVVGMCVAAGSLTAGMLRVRRIASRGRRVEDASWLNELRRVARRYGLTRLVTLVSTDSATLLATWGVLRPQVLLPHHARTWTAERIHVVLCHELAHIRRHDWIVQFGAEVMRAILWFNPLAWMVCARLRRYSEQACDDEVLAAGVGAQSYAAELFELARQCRRPGSTWASAVPMAHPSTLERRIVAMLKPELDRSRPSRRVIATVGVGLVLVALPVASVVARQAPSASPGRGADTHVASAAVATNARVVSMPVAAATPAAAAPVVDRRVPVRQQSLSGTIYDVTGGVLPGVQVTLVDANEIASTVASNASGHFEFPAVAPGRYVLAVAVPGFRELRHAFTLAEARDWNRAVTLQVAEVRETVTIRSSRDTAQPAATGVPAGPVRVGGNIRAPKKLVDVKPVYPVSMREAGLSGTVPIEAIIGIDGTVSVVRVLSAQVHPDFAIAAADAVRQWRFMPTLLNNAPVEVVMTVRVQFDFAN